MATRKPRRYTSKAFGLLPGSEVVNPTLPSPPVIPLITTNGGEDLAVQVNVGAIDAVALSYVGSGTLVFDHLGPDAADFEVTPNGVVRFKSAATYTGSPRQITVTLESEHGSASIDLTIVVLEPAPIASNA